MPLLRDVIQISLHPADNLISMPEQETVLVPFTREEAWEILARCLASHEPDTGALRSAMHKLAHVVEPKRREKASRLPRTG